MILPKQTILVALAALLILSGLGNAPGVVLCLADDGHAQFEFAREDNCADFVVAENDRAGGVGRQLRGPPSGSSHCGSCVDLPIGIGDPERPQDLVLQSANPSVKAPLALARDFSFPLAVCATRQAPGQPAGRETPASLRASVLLI